MNLQPRATFFLVLTVVALLSLLSFLPIGELADRKSIFSQLYSDSSICTTAGYEIPVDISPVEIAGKIDIDKDLYIDSTKRETVRRQQPDSVDDFLFVDSTADHTVHINHSDSLLSDTTAVGRPKAQPKPQPIKPSSLVAIEDFSSSGEALGRLYANMLQAKSMSRPVRIAVLGDSFIEGDIFTQDLREQLQSRFGGRGVGFVPITSMVAGFRQSVHHEFEGWSTHSIVNNRARGGYLMSSFTYTPSDDVAQVTYRGSRSRARLNYFSKARFLFRSLGSAKVKVSINGAVPQIFSTTPNVDLRQIVVGEDSIERVTFIVQGDDKFTAYGAYLDSSNGVSVDNYSVRGNSGASLASIDAKLTGELGEMLPIDLVIFEYGLNVVQGDEKSFSLYLSQMTTAIEHLKRCLPNVAILVMSIPDRTRRSGDDWVTMPGVEAMARVQRQLAHTTGVAFWNTLAAMRTRGGMSKFVERGWAAKDYTHLSQRGGREVARALFEALMYDMQSRY
ncbi:MAG: GDSL-type esterase/lipase family protein [Mucinivorans sp.]